MRVFPKKKKFIKEHKGKGFNKITKEIIYNPKFKGFIVVLKNIQHGFMRIRQIRMSRLQCRKATKKIGNLKIRIHADTPITSKPIGVRMGKGKGAFKRWNARISCASTLLYLNMLQYNLIKFAIQVLSILQKKLPLKTIISTI